MNTTHRMGRKKLNRERIQVTLPQGMAERLAAAAAEKGWDRSQLLEELAAAYLKKWEKEKREKEDQQE